MWGSEQMIEVDGLPLRVMRAGDGPPLLLINGIGAPVEMWAPLASRMTGHELVAFDLPGAGKSPPSRYPLRIRGLARTAEGLIDALGFHEMDVLGYSFGGVVAQELARRAPRRVDRLVLCATFTGVGSQPPRPLPTLLMLSPLRYTHRSIAKRVVPVIAGGRTRRDPSALHSHLEHRLSQPPTTIGYLQQLYAITGWSSAGWIDRLQHRTLILHGSEDPLVPLANARRMAAAMPAAQLRVTPAGGHLFLLDEPESVIPDLECFLARSHDHDPPHRPSMRGKKGTDALRGL
jgi:pimeloyl-ACP methyl ester carboxylesterase